jgi:cell division protein ZapA
MSESQTPITVTILDREYVVGGTPSQRAELISAAALVDERLRALRANARTASLDRLAVLVALNLAHELTVRERDADSTQSGVAAEVAALRSALSSVSPRR